MSENKYDVQHACNYDGLLKENARLKELNRQILKLLDDFLGIVELSPPAQHIFDEIVELLLPEVQGE